MTHTWQWSPCMKTILIFRSIALMSHSAYSPMEQGELEESPGYHSPVMQHHEEDMEEEEVVSDSPVIIENPGER